jgi:hypothetical protein
MMKRMRAGCLLAAVVLAAPVTSAASPFLVTVDTSTLSGTHTLVFALTNFDPASNEVAVSEVSFDGGGAIAGTDECTFGASLSGLGCSGDLDAGVQLEDVDPIAAFFAQQFVAGAGFSFVLDATNNFSGATPDQFAMFVCDAGVTACYSDDATAAMLLLDLIGGTLTPSSFLLFGAADQALAAPVVTAVAAPEPSVLLLLGGGLAAWVVRRRQSTCRGFSPTPLKNV